MNNSRRDEFTKPGSWPMVRKFFNDIHLWLGLISGVVIFFVCLSGTIYVFNTEIREMAAPHLYKVKQTGLDKLSIGQLMTLVKTKSEGNIASIKIPSDPEKSYTFIVKTTNDGDKKIEKSTRERAHIASEEIKHARSNQPDGVARKNERSGRAAGAPAGRGTPYMINPYTGEVLGNIQSIKTGASEFMGIMFSLHRWLLLDKIEEPIFDNLENRKLGSYITGTATILFSLGVITGIVIWVPRRVRGWKQGLRIKWGGNWKRVNHDLHNSLGLYSCVLLLLMGFTGPQWSFPWYREGLRKTLGTYESKTVPPPQGFVSVIPGSEAGRPLSIEDYLAIADKKLNYNGDYSIQLPTDSTGVIVISKNATGFFAPVAADKIILDQYTGSVLSIEVFRDKPFNERLAGSIKALHIGDVYGTFSKILYFIACLIATSLPVTGTLIWINKLKKK